VIRGTDTLRYGSEEIPRAEGDYVHLPAAEGERERVVAFLRHEPVDYWEGKKRK
jgi:hypothetical protein